MECWKNGYSSEREARTVANYRHNRRGAPKLYVYKCWNCRLWHITRRDQSKPPHKINKYAK